MSSSDDDDIWSDLKEHAKGMAQKIRSSSTVGLGVKKECLLGEGHRCVGRLEMGLEEDWGLHQIVSSQKLHYSVFY